MSGTVTNVIYHAPGSPGYENATIHEISVTGHKAEELRQFLSNFTDAQQVFPPADAPSETYCRFQFPPHMTVAEIQATVTCSAAIKRCGDIKFT